LSAVLLLFINVTKESKQFEDDFQVPLSNYMPIDRVVDPLGKLILYIF